MNKTKKTEHKKILVRNAAQPLPKVIFVDEETRDKNTKTKKNVKPTKSSMENSTKFNIPELNSTLAIAKKIDLVEKAKPPKVADLAFDEKTTRKMNFPLDQPIYKDLIPLQVPKKQQQPLSSREPLPQKDKEPNLADFAAPKQTKEFSHQPIIKMENNSVAPGLDSLKLYKILSLHNI